jgi:hypothetical protein
LLVACVSPSLVVFAVHSLNKKLEAFGYDRQYRSMYNNHQAGKSSQGNYASTQPNNSNSNRNGAHQIAAAWSVRNAQNRPSTFLYTNPQQYTPAQHQQHQQQRQQNNPPAQHQRLPQQYTPTQQRQQQRQQNNPPAEQQKLHQLAPQQRPQNRPMPQLAAAMPQFSRGYIYATNLISARMHELVPHHSVAYLNLVAQLPLAYRYIMANSITFQFHSRPRMPQESYQEYVTKEALFYLQKLQGVAPDLAKNQTTLVGLRCSCCYAGSSMYIKGSTNFVDVRGDNVVNTLVSAITGRLKHMITCSHVPNENKGILFSFKASEADARALKVFLIEWLRVLKAAYFLPKVSMPSLPPQRHQQHLKPSTLAPTFNPLAELEVTEDGIYSDLLKSISSARHMKGTETIFDDLAEGPVTLDGKEPLIMEHFLQNYQIRVSRTAQWQVQLECSHCSHGHHSITELLSAEIDDNLVNTLWGFVSKHCQECNSTPSNIRRQLQTKSVEPPLKHLSLFCKGWKAYLQKLSRWTKLSVSPKPDLDLFRPITLEFLKEHGNLPCHQIDNPKVPDRLPVNLNINAVILGSEVHNDSEGNRRFRQLLSEHRTMYSKVTSEHQYVIAMSLLKLIVCRGGNFFTLDTEGVCIRVETKKCLEHAEHCLKNGFPEMLRRPMVNNATTKVYDVEYPARVGQLHGQIRWENASSAMPRLFVSDLKSGKINFRSKIPLAGRKEGGPKTSNTERRLRPTEPEVIDVASPTMPSLNVSFKPGTINLGSKNPLAGRNEGGPETSNTERRSHAVEPEGIHVDKAPAREIITIDDDDTSARTEASDVGEAVDKAPAREIITIDDDDTSARTEASDVGEAPAADSPPKPVEAAPGNADQSEKTAAEQGKAELQTSQSGAARQSPPRKTDMAPIDKDIACSKSRKENAASSVGIASTRTEDSVDSNAPTGSSTENDTATSNVMDVPNQTDEVVNVNDGRNQTDEVVNANAPSGMSTEGDGITNVVNDEPNQTDQVVNANAPTGMSSENDGFSKAVDGTKQTDFVEVVLPIQLPKQRTPLDDASTDDTEMDSRAKMKASTKIGADDASRDVEQEQEQCLKRKRDGLDPGPHMESSMETADRSVDQAGSTAPGVDTIEPTEEETEQTPKRPRGDGRIEESQSESFIEKTPVGRFFKRLLGRDEETNAPIQSQETAPQPLTSEEETLSPSKSIVTPSNENEPEGTERKQPASPVAHKESEQPSTRSEFIIIDC